MDKRTVLIEAAKIISDICKKHDWCDTECPMFNEYHDMCTIRANGFPHQWEKTDVEEWVDEILNERRG